MLLSPFIFTKVYAMLLRTRIGIPPNRNNYCYPYLSS